MGHPALEHVPVISNEGLDIKVYSGSLAGISSPVQNYVPVIIADIQLQPLVTTTLQIPASYNGFLYVIDGNVKVGDDNETLKYDQVGWLDLPIEKGESELQLTAGETGVRVVLYAGEPQGDPIVSHGPFIADTQEDIKRLYHEYRSGEMEHISKVPSAQRIMW